MAEDTAAVPPETNKVEDTPAPSTSADKVEGDDADCEAKKLMGAGHRHLVMKDIRSAVAAFQEASGLLAKKYGDTADECADAFFSYGISLLELARMENGVLGNALEGMPEEEDGDGEKEDPNIPSAANLDEKERDELREQVYDAMAEDEKPSSETKGEGESDPKAEGNGKCDTKTEEKAAEGDVEMEVSEKEAEEPSAEKEKAEKPVDAEESEKAEAPKVAETKDECMDEKVDKPEEGKVSDGKSEVAEADSTEMKEEKSEDKSTDEASAKPAETSPSKEKSDGQEKEKPGEEKEKPGEEQTEDQEQMEGEEDDGDDSGDDGEDNEETEEKETEDDEDVGNLQLAWEMLDLSKVIFKRKDTKEAQLKAAQAHLKLGEVSVESENYSQAVEDFLACLNIQKEHLEAHDRLLAETLYQLGLAYQYNGRHEDAISHFTQSTEVIEKRMALLSEQKEKAEEVQKEMDELKGLLPDIREKIEDSKEAQKSPLTEIALKETLAAGSSGFSKENGSTSAAPVEKSGGDCTVPVTNCVSDISHLVRKKRKPEESPLKDSEAKKSKQEAVENGDAVVPTNEEADKAEAEKPTPMETAAVETTA
ncbi:nuclear autoantigenic sperm protein isoform X2 [Spea bombifrons]|uniref:nuclear autoantigenic sperm protein isoform X2 n=1 Tax=Spea bombifrons TaxID=233779 RepID=UPI002349F379|nr:nuclear autoantigenic sperm protein isoform X2 [Spea bombifrons]